MFQALQREWERSREHELSLYAEIHATLRNTALGKGYTPPSGEVWTADMFLPNYQAKPSAPDWRKDLAAISGPMAKFKKHQAQFTPDGREMRKKSIEERRISIERRRTADQMKRDGAGPKKIKHYLLTGER